MLRLLPLLCLLLLAQASLSQQIGAPATNGVPSSCPVTKPYQTSLFVPPSPYEANAGAGSFWFGTDRLWTVLPADGTWTLGHHKPSNPTFRQKLFWWRQGYDWRTEPLPKLTITGRRLDAQAAPLKADRANNVSSQPAAMVVGINFPTLGCWEVTGRYGDDTLTFVVWIAK
jgi:hypothetical protein